MDPTSIVVLLLAGLGANAVGVLTNYFVETKPFRELLERIDSVLSGKQSSVRGIEAELEAAVVEFSTTSKKLAR